MFDENVSLDRNGTGIPPEQLGAELRKLTHKHCQLGQVFSLLKLQTPRSRNSKAFLSQFIKNTHQNSLQLIHIVSVLCKSSSSGLQTSILWLLLCFLHYYGIKRFYLSCGVLEATYLALFEILYNLEFFGC